MITQAGGRPSSKSRWMRLHGAGVVERHGDRQIDDVLRDAVAVRQRRVVLALADLVVRHGRRDHHVVVVSCGL
jgi:hypothetical protein